MRHAPLSLNRPPTRHGFNAGRNRIEEINNNYGGRVPSVPQSFHDFVAADSANSNTHPHMGPFTHVAVQDGLWSDPATWDTGTVPGEDAVVNISIRTVTYDLESDVLVKDIHVSGAGTLKWATDKDTRLWIDTIMCHGTFIMGTADDPISESQTLGKPRAEIVFHQTEAPEATTRLGLNTMGPVRIVGAQKADRLYSPKSILAGQRYIKLEGLTGSNLRPGDKILFLATANAGTSSTDSQYTGPTQFYGPYQGSDAVRTCTLGYHLSQDEVRTITEVIGDTIGIDAPLDYDHIVTTGTLPHGQVVTINPIAASLSRSIRFRSAAPSSLQTRAHTMFMHHDDIEAWYAECLNMGRTDTNPSLARPDGSLAYDVDGGDVITDSDNVRGRYPWHIHVTGAYFGRKQIIFKGLTTWAPTDEVPQPGWAITHHGSRAAIENCVVYNVRGAGIVSELGNETGQWLNNTVAWCRGDGYPVSWFSRAELWQNHNGHAGVAYECQARQILQQENIASSSHFGWVFIQQAVDELSRIPDKFSLRLYDAMTQGGNFGNTSNVYDMDDETYGIEQAQIPDFNDNLCLGCGIGFVVAHRQFTERTDTTPMITRRFHCVNTVNPVNIINYTFNYSFYDFLWTGTGTGNGARIGSVTWQFLFVNGLLRNFNTGFFNAGLSFNFNGWWIDLAFESVATSFTSYTATLNLTSWAAANPGGVFPDDWVWKDFMGPMTTTSYTPGTSWTGILREWKSLNSLTELPQPYPAPTRGHGGVEPSPGTPKPYFVLDPASDTVLTDTPQSVELQGTIVDHVGVRHWPDWMSSESFNAMTNYVGRATRSNQNATATDLVLRNGCFQDDGVWKTRVWFVEHERLTGEYFQFHVDLTLPAMDAGFLAANTVVPVAPELPLKAESVGAKASPLVFDITPPIITTPDAAIVDEGVELAHILKANDGHVNWSITGGADQAQFEINGSAGVYTLRWAENGTQSHSSPADSDANNAYSVQVTATNPLGYSSSQIITVIVKEANLRLWLDTSDAASITQAGGLVSQLNDKSGNGYHFTQATDANKPASGTRTINGLNALDFQGSQWLEAPAGFRGIGSGPNTLIVVMKADSSSTGMRPVNGSVAGNSRLQLALATGAYTVLNVTSGSATSTSITRDTNTHIIGWRRDGADIQGFLDGVLGTAGSNAQNTGTLNALGIGRDPVNTFSAFDGLIAEVKWFGADLTDAELNAKCSALATKWGTTWTPI